MNRVLLTGATGFIGRHAAPLLAAAGFEVHTALPERLRAEWLRAAAEADLSAVRLHACDLLDAGEQARLMAALRPTHVLHLAWYVTPGKFWSAAENIDWVIASLNLMRSFCTNGGERWVGAGTCAEYDWDAGGECDEMQTPLRPATLYGASKHALAVLQAGMATALPGGFAWGRVFHLYGPGEPPERLVPEVIRSLLAGVPAVLGHGGQVRDFTHVGDVANAFVTLLSSDISGPVNIGSGERAPVCQVAESIAGLLGRRDLLRFGGRPSAAQDPPVLVPALARLRGIGFAPRWTLTEGLAATIDWWRSEQHRNARVG